MKNIWTLILVVSTLILHAQSIPSTGAFHFKNTNSILPGRIFGTERETGHHIQDDKRTKDVIRSASLFSIQIVDSLLFWQWDTASNSWMHTEKITDIAYNDDNVPKSYTVYEWDGEWLPGYRYILAFDDNNNIINEVEQSWNGSDWTNSYKTISLYDEHNNLVSLAIQQWEENDWVNSSLQSLSYNEYNNLVSELLQSYNGTDWTNESIYMRTYDANQNILSFTLQSWQNDAWVNEGQYLYTYDSQNNLTGNVYQTWESDEWQNVVRYSFTYDLANLKTSELSQYWDGSAWSDYARFSFTYNGQDQLINQFVEEWDGSNWLEADFYTYTYDANGKETSIKREVWSGADWINAEESGFEYIDTFLLSETYKYYNEFGDAVLYGDSSYYYFQLISGTVSPTTADNDILVFPNPGYGKITIKCTIPVTSLQVYNLQGQIIYSNDDYSGTQIIEADLSDAGQGIYFAKIVCAGNSYSRMIVIQ